MGAGICPFSEDVTGPVSYLQGGPFREAVGTVTHLLSGRGCTSSQGKHRFQCFQPILLALTLTFLPLFLGMYNK